MYSFDPILLEPSCAGHVRSSSTASSVPSVLSSVESTPGSGSSRLTTPPLRASPLIRHHGPVLLPKIRSQDQNIDEVQSVRTAARPVMDDARLCSPTPVKVFSERTCPSHHSRNFTNPESTMAYNRLSPFPSVCSLDEQPVVADPAPLLNSSVEFDTFIGNDGSNLAVMGMEPGAMVSHRRASSCHSLDAGALRRYGYPTYRQMPVMAPSGEYAMRTPPPELPCHAVYVSTGAQSPLKFSRSPEQYATAPRPLTTLARYLMRSNPAASLVRTISFPARSPAIKYFWWDVRNIRSWSSFNSQAIMNLPGALSTLSSPVPASVLAQTTFASRHPETEVALHDIYASYYLPRLNSALAVSSARPLQFSVPNRSSNSINDLLFVANATGGSSNAAAIFGGKPSARVVGLVRSFDCFNTGMRVEGNIKRVEYLRGLAALHFAMREHSCRYGFIMTEIELVLVRCGTESTPYFGHLEITSVQLSANAPEEINPLDGDTSTPLTACLALWGLCCIASDDTPAGQAHWKSEIGAPAEGTRRKAKPRDAWMPQPQLAEKREAKRSRGWIWPEDAIGRKELGKRGVKYGGL